MPKKFTKDGGKIILENTRRTKTSSASEEEKYLAYLREREAKKLAANPPEPVITEEKVEPKVEIPEVQPEIPVVAPDPMERYRSALKYYSLYYQSRQHRCLLRAGLTEHSCIDEGLEEHRDSSS